MKLALSLAERGICSTSPNPRVGCVIVKDDEVIGKGWHQMAGGPHAEINAIEDCDNPEILAGATVYVTLEPCCHHSRTAPCVDELIKHKIKKVYVAMRDPNPAVNGKGIDKLRAAGIEVECGLLEEEAKGLNRGFVKRHLSGLPWVRLKVAQTMDGAMALDSPTTERTRPQWITGEQARKDVHYWRARSCAVLSGATSITQDDSRLDVRMDDFVDIAATNNKTATAPLLIKKPMKRCLKQPLRIALDPQYSLAPSLAFFKTPGPKLWVGADDADDSPPSRPPPDTNLLLISRVEPTGGLNSIYNKELDLKHLLEGLAQREINELMVESGPRLVKSFLATGLVDELILYIAPHKMGDTNVRSGIIVNDSLTEINIEKMEELKFNLKEVKQFGDDLRLLATGNRL